MSKQAHRDKVVIETKDKTKIPGLVVEGKENKVYNLPVGTRLIIEENESVKAGQVIAKIPRTMRKSGDITGGLLV
jgi:DNA-directed RNA polymerase subunit beta'